MERLSVDAVLFDSGGVLIGRIGGRWNPRRAFEEVLRRRGGVSLTSCSRRQSKLAMHSSSVGRHTF